jgi:radical SAM family uncharacterized protein
MLEDILLQVNKPARYIAGEWNVTRKDFSKAKIKFALCFPDLYEIGMSNLGMRIIYGLLNSISYVVCERFFSCAVDMETHLRSNSLEIFSLESKRRLREFDLIGFSLGSELNYTNILNILELGNIPLKSSERDESYPLVIGGGPCTLNPEPLSEFFDLFIIGEAEESILELMDIYQKHQEKYKGFNRINKTDLLYLFSQIKGVYVPALYKAGYRIKKRFIRDLNTSFFPSDWLVPFIQIVHDRISLEIMRGCPNRCYFCQGRSQYYPYRIRERKNLLNLAKDIYRNTGYEEISLAGLSVSDYPKIEGLLSELINFFKDNAVSVSLPSIKVKEKTGNLSSLIAKIKKTGLTFAPEAGSKRLRKIIAKDFNEDEFFKVIQDAYSSGYQHIKLYFMLGLPYEERQDLDAIIDFSIRASELRRRISKAPAKINVSINAFIPKPHTPFQWFKMEGIESIKQKQAYLKNKIKNRNIILNFHNPDMSFLEGVLSRGDRRLSEVIHLAFKKGARFDAWTAHFNFQAWLDAFKESDIDPDFYLRQMHKDEILPWDFIDVGISKETLIKEFDKCIIWND